MRGRPAGARTGGTGLTGRLGAWHSYRWQWWIAGLVVYLALPWRHVVPGGVRDVVVLNVVVGLAWAVPVWRMGVVVDRRGVRCIGVVGSRRYRWEDIVGASVEWHDLEPRLRLELADGDEVWAPGFRMPQHQAYRRDLWRDSQMYAAADLIAEEAQFRHLVRGLR